MNPKLLIGVVFAFLLCSPASSQWSVGTVLPSAEDQYMLELINRFRDDPQGELARILDVGQGVIDSITKSSTGTAGDGTPHSANFWTNLAGTGGQNAAIAMDSWFVHPGDLTRQWSDLPGSSVEPLAWNKHLGHSADQYNDLIVMDAGATSDPHSIAPYSPYSDDRVVDAGYKDDNPWWVANTAATEGATFGENLFKEFFDQGSTTETLDYAHAAFLIDWGGPGNGIQDPAGHRTTAVSSTYREIGIDFQTGYSGATSRAMTQHFGVRRREVLNAGGTSPEDVNGDMMFTWPADSVEIVILTGVIFDDSDSDNFYTPGEGMSVGFDVRDGSNNVVASGTSWASGGYSVDITDFAPGTYSFETANGWTESFTVGATASNLSITLIPEPSTMLLLTTALLGLAFRRRRAHFTIRTRCVSESPM